MMMLFLYLGIVGTSTALYKLSFDQSTVHLFEENQNVKHSHR